MSDDTDLRADIAAAKGKMRVTLGAGREIKRLTSYLWEGETVDQMTTGTYGNGNGLVVLTDRRLLFVQDGLMSKTSEDFPLDKVSSVQWTSGMLTGAIVIFASGNKADIKNIVKDDGKEIVDKIRHACQRRVSPLRLLLRLSLRWTRSSNSGSLASCATRGSSPMRSLR